MMKEKELKIAIIGKSAAGKSAFIRSFSKAAELIDSEGIAQTTRTYAEYKYYVTNDEIQPKVFAKIVNKSDFIEQRVEQVATNIIQKLKLNNLDFEELKLKLDKTSLYIKAVKDSILHMKDFFDIYEFDFLNSNKIMVSKLIETLVDNFISEIQNYNAENKKNEDVLKYLQEIYSKIYDILIENLKEHYMGKNVLFDDNNELIFKFQLNHDEVQTLSLLLKVIEDGNSKKSLTGIVSKVVVESQICDKYFDILNKMRISKLSLIDTYGLDHSKQASSDVLVERYNKIFNVDYPDITVVFYIVALHKGTSSDLQQAISVLYEQRPDLMSYIIGTYIDENQLDEFTENWLLKFDKNTDERPTLQGQIIDYLYNDDIILGLINNGISENMALKRTEVMRNRFAPFCGKEDIIVTKQIMEKMNAISISALLFSINNLEHLGSNYIDIDMIILKLNTSINLSKIIVKFIEVATRRFNEIFCRAQSRTKGKIRTNLHDFVLGFDGSTLDATWKRIFRDAYNEVFTKEIQLDGMQAFSLAEDFKLEGNMKVAFNEILNSFFKEWFARECSTNYFNRIYASEVDCSKCCSKQSFMDSCIWGVFVNSVGINNMQNKPEKETVQEWLCKIHNINEKMNDDQIERVVNIFKEKFRTTFVKMCRFHNARIMSQKIISVQDEKEFFVIKQEHLQDYFEKYDKSADKKQINHMLSFFLSKQR